MPKWTSYIHFGVKQLKIGRTMGVLYSFVWDHVNYANMEGFCRDSHKCTSNYFIWEFIICVWFVL